MYLTLEQREAIAVAALSGATECDALIAQLRTWHPEAFHTPETLSQRVFFDQPVRGEPCRGFIRFAPKQAA